MFDPVSETLVETDPVLTLRQIELLSSWQPIVYILACLPLTILQNRPDGLRRAVHVGAISELVGSILKLSSTLMPLPSLRLALLHFGQISSAVASPVAIGAPALLSSLWFGESDRTKATAAAVLSNDIGLSIGFVVIPLLTNMFGFRSVFLLESTSALVVAYCAVLWFPRAVRHNVEETEDGPVAKASENSSTFTEMRLMLSNLTCCLLCAVYAWVAGGYIAWTSLFSEVLVFNENFSDVFVGFVSFAGMVGFVVGGLVVSYFTDLYFRRTMGRVILICAICNTIVCWWFVVILGFSVVPKDADDEHIAQKAAVLGLSFLAGCFNGGAAPVFYEFVAQLSAPRVSEAVSGNLLSLTENIGALIIYQCLLRFVPTRFVCFGYAVGMSLIVVVMLFVPKGRPAPPASLEMKDITIVRHGRGERARTIESMVEEEDEGEDQPLETTKTR